MHYLTNEANSIKVWTVDANNQCVKTGMYGAGELYVNEVLDENGSKMREYKDKEGKVILKEAYLGTTPLQTYYVYDDFGLLRYVIPPKASKNIPDKFDCTNEKAKELVYYYQYDARKRMIIKKLPGAAPVFMVYDKRDRLVAVQDGNSRANKNGNVADPLWVFTKYDAFNRPVVTGILKVNKTTQADMQSEVETKYAGRSFFVTRTGNGDYSDESYPRVNDVNIEILTKTYYDDYDYPSKIDERNITKNAAVKGLVTGTATKILNQSTSNFIYSTTYYDDKYRPIQMLRKGFVPEVAVSEETVTNAYDFSGKLVSSTQKQNVNSKITILIKTPTYDHAGRLVATKLKVNNTEKTISKLTYNKLGQLANKKLQPDALVETTDYTYNIRGWLKKLNGMITLGTTQHFGMEPYYNDVMPNLTNKPKWNGNITAQRWKASSKPGTEYAYVYEYDDLNRLNKADYGSSDNWTSAAYDESGIMSNLLKTVFFHMARLHSKSGNATIFKKNAPKIRLNYMRPSRFFSNFAS